MKQQSKLTDQNALTRVEIEPAENSSDFAAGLLIGEATAYTVAHALQWSLMVAKASEVKASKAYKVLGLTWPAFCQQRFRVDFQTMDRWIADFRTFGRSALLLQDAIQLSRRALHALNPEDLGGGKFRIGNREFDGITQETLPEIKDYVEDALKAKEKAQEVAADKTRDAKKYKSERDAVEREKAAIEAELDALKNPPPAPFQQRMKDLQWQFEGFSAQVNALLGQEHSEQDADHLGGLVEHVYFEMVQMRARAASIIGLGANNMTPSAAGLEIEMADVETPKKRSLIPMPGPRTAKR